MIGLAHADPATADTVLAPLDQLGAPLYHDMKKRSIASMAALDPASHMKTPRHMARSNI
jgi:hypothetical protein